MLDFVRYALGWSYMRLSRRRLTVVTYHPNKTAAGKYADVLRQFRFLSQNFRPILPSDLNGEIPRERMAMVAADDGHQDTYHLLFRAALETGVRLVIALPTDFYLRKKWLWFDLLEWAMDVSRARSDEFWQNRNFAVQRQTWLRALKAMPPECRQSELAHILDRLKIDSPPSPPTKYSPLTSNQMHEMLDSGLVELAGHTVSHTIATALSPEELANELRQSRAELEEISGRPVTAFCYPNGLPGDFDERTRAALAEAGFRHAFTCVEGTNARGCDMLELRRVHAHERFGVFVKMVSGLIDVQSQFRGWVGEPGSAAQQSNGEASLQSERASQTPLGGS